MPHPGSVLKEQFMTPNGLSQYRVAVDIGVPPRRINEIVHGRRAITADTALRLARYFGNDPLYWLELQARYDLELEQHRLGRRLQREVQIYDPAEPPPGRGRRPQPVPATSPNRPDDSHLFFD